MLHHLLLMVNPLVTHNSASSRVERGFLIGTFGVRRPGLRGHTQAATVGRGRRLNKVIGPVGLSSPGY